MDTRWKSVDDQFKKIEERFVELESRIEKREQAMNTRLDEIWELLKKNRESRSLLGPAPVRASTPPTVAEVVEVSVIVSSSETTTEVTTATMSEEVPSLIQPKKEGFLPWFLNPRFDLPILSNQNPRDWLSRCEEYFSEYKIESCKWLELASPNLDGVAKRWFDGWILQNPNVNWKQFIEGLCERFESRDSGGVVKEQMINDTNVQVGDFVPEEEVGMIMSSCVEVTVQDDQELNGDELEKVEITGLDMSEPGYVIESGRSFEVSSSSRRCVSNGMVAVDINSEMILSISSSSLYELTGIMILVYDPGKWLKRIVKLGMDLSVANLNFYAFLQVSAFHIWDPGDLDVINKEQIQLCCDVASALLECGSLGVFELGNVLPGPKAGERRPRRFMEAIKHTTKLRHVAKQQQAVLKQFGGGDYGCPDVVTTVDLQQQAPVGIDKTFWSMLEHARSLNLNVPLQSADFNALSDRRDNKAISDHSVQIGLVRSENAVQANMALEFHRNKERFGFLKWGANACDNMLEVPPSSEIVHQVNLEYLGRVVFNRDGILCLDSVVGTDSHTTLIDSLKVAGWGVGRIETKAVMLGQPMSMVLPGVVGFKLVGKLRDGVTATDLVLTVTHMLREHGIVDKFVELYDEDMSKLSLADRATIANMSPEYGATMGFLPVDHVTLQYLKLTVRSEEKLKEGLIGVTWDDWCHFVNVQLVKNLHRYRVAEMVFLSWLYKLFNEKTWKMTSDLVLNQTFSHLRTSVL